MTPPWRSHLTLKPKPKWHPSPFSFNANQEADSLPGVEWDSNGVLTGDYHVKLTPTDNVKADVSFYTYDIDMEARIYLAGKGNRARAYINAMAEEADLDITLVKRDLPVRIKAVTKSGYLTLNLPHDFNGTLKATLELTEEDATDIFNLKRDFKEVVELIDDCINDDNRVVTYRVGTNYCPVDKPCKCDRAYLSAFYGGEITVGFVDEDEDERYY